MFSEDCARQTELMLRCIPAVAEQDCFALKGGSAINFFVRDMPRLSVDIDLTYCRLADRDTSLSEIDQGLKAIANAVRETIDGAVVTPRVVQDVDAILELRELLRHGLGSPLAKRRNIIGNSTLYQSSPLRSEHGIGFAVRTPCWSG